MRQIQWNSKARDFIRSLDNETKREIGTWLRLIQDGAKLSPPLAKPMTIIHKSAFELRIRDRKGIYRIIYVLNIHDKILIPHAFTKKTQKTPAHEIILSVNRLQEMINENK